MRQDGLIFGYKYQDTISTQIFSKFRVHSTRKFKVRTKLRPVLILRDCVDNKKHDLVQAMALQDSALYRLPDLDSGSW